MSLKTTAQQQVTIQMHDTPSKISNDSEMM